MDGGKGLLAALPLVYGEIPVQRCWAHKTRNVLNHVKRADQQKVKRPSIASVMLATFGKLKSGPAICRQWQILSQGGPLPSKRSAGSAQFSSDSNRLGSLRALRTTNAIERRFVEVRRRTRPMGTFSDRTSIERILVFSLYSMRILNSARTPFLLLTQNS